jgi:ferrous iron transport protein B
MALNLPQGCHGQAWAPLPAEEGRRKVFLVGNPNVGKSVLFNALTGSYAVVSNYPGTTVEVSRGSAELGGGRWEVTDTPGMYSLRTITEEERVSRDLILGDEGTIVHVVDAKNLPRMLPLTLELCMMGRPLVLALNLMDEAARAGVKVDTRALSIALGIPVVEMVATRGEGIQELKAILAGPIPPPPSPKIFFPPRLEESLEALRPHISGEAWRFWALHALEGDAPALERAKLPDELLSTLRARAGLGPRRGAPSALVAKSFHASAQRVLAGAYKDGTREKVALQERLDRLLLNPWTGFPILAVIVYVGLYRFVGVFGGGTVVDFLETTVFGRYVNPYVEALFAHLVPWMWLRTLFVGDYGIFTLGLRYAIAIILPIVGTFFLAFSVLEDSGYLPRLAMMLDRIFKAIGLNGRAVIPLVLGFGCDTMATMTTRILETKRERIIATFLLALAIPCSAQIGLLLALLAGHPAALALWAAIVTGVFLLAGTLMARLLPGQKPAFFMELPPLRMPVLKNVWSKTVSRMGWYFLEVFPLFIVASVMIWVGQITGIFPKVVEAIVPLVKALGLPPQTAVAILFGFFRRDYGAAGLFDLRHSGLMNGVQLLVATVTLTLFLPCIAQFLIMRKERGWKVTLLMSGVILFIAFGVGWGLNAVLVAAKVTL